ncbi:hypothetical protein EW146_g6206 [Bondarzewia mesenterica]|uniref:Actin-like ATPase domain-containing protein n=1 Tax=Bondarzewia mesenterica TaxID=1095465 RepID=A0A4S4LP89_9AGAM|nr:hypothetical protein EW146_g6206 [Bondarzewia mesenterica]
MAINNSVPNGRANFATGVPSVPTVVGINFGNSYASIAVITNEGQAECIANEDGERQIACAISFHGEEMYIGSQARQQLVKNSENTITGFRNLLGKKFSELTRAQSVTSAAVIQHPDLPDEPAYKVKILQSSPSPLPSATTTKTNTPAASQTATPRSEPVPAERILTPSEVTTIFLKSLLQSAEDFLGKKAAEAAEINVLQLLEDAGAAAVTANSAPQSEDLHPDRTQLIVDLGSSSLAVTLLSVRQGLFHALASSYDHSIEKADARAEARLRLALEHTKRTISASPGAATCSVESLKDGLDFHGTINRLRFDMEARSIYNAVYAKVQDLLSSVGLDFLNVDEVVYVGGSACLPGLDDALAQGYSEFTVSPFTVGTVAGGGTGDPTTMIARGDEEVRQAFAHTSKWSQVTATSRTLGILFPEEGAEGLGGQWISVVPRETAVPARRTLAFDVDLGDLPGEKRVGFEVWQVEEGIKVTKVKPPKEEEDGHVEEEEEEEEIEMKEKTVAKDAYLASVVFEAKQAQQIGGRWKTRVEVQFLVGADGVDVSAWEVGKAGRGVKVSAS